MIHAIHLIFEMDFLFPYMKRIKCGICSKIDNYKVLLMFFHVDMFGASRLELMR